MISAQLLLPLFLLLAATHVTALQRREERAAPLRRRRGRHNHHRPDDRTMHRREIDCSGEDNKCTTMIVSDCAAGDCEVGPQGSLSHTATAEGQVVSVTTTETNLCGNLGVEAIVSIIRGSARRGQGRGRPGRIGRRAGRPVKFDITDAGAGRCFQVDNGDEIHVSTKQFIKDPMMACIQAGSLTYAICDYENNKRPPTPRVDNTTDTSP